MAFILKRPADNKEVILKPNYQYVNETQQKNKYSRSLHTAFLGAQVYTFKRFILELPYVSVGTSRFLEEWFRSRDHLKFTQDNAVVTVDNGFDVKIVKYQLKRFSMPNVYVFKKGIITLEEF